MAGKLASRVRGLSEAQFLGAYGTEERCRAVVEKLRWPSGFRLNAPGVSHGLEAKGVLMGLMRFVGKLDPEVRIGAIRRVRAGRRTRIFITPEGVYRGLIDNLR